MKIDKWLILTLLTGLFLRLLYINQSLWLDEAIGAIASRDFDLLGILGNFIKFDNHPPLYYLLLRLWTAIFGFSELSLRMPSIIFGVATIYSVFKIDKILNINTKSGKLGTYFLAILLATSQIHVYYSQEARMYSMAAFLVSLSVYLFLSTISSKNASSWVLFSITNVLIFFTDYLPVLVFAVFFAFAIVNVRDQSWWKKFLISFIPLGVSILIWFPTLFIQSASGKWLLATVPNWADVSGGANLKQLALVWMKYSFGRITLVNKNLYYSLTLLVSLPFALLFAKSLDKRTLKNFYVYWFVVPIFLTLLLSLFIPAFNYFRLIYILPAFYGISVYSLKGIKPQKLGSLLFGVLILINTVSLVIYYLDNVNQREDWKGAAKYISNNIKPSEIVLFSYPQPFAPYRWYSKDDYSFGSTDSILATDKSEDITNKLLTDRNGVYYFEYLSGLSDPSHIVQTSLVQNGFQIQKTYNFNGVGIVYYYTR